MIRSVHIENYKCFRNFDIELGAFNVIIGPNDCGKTAFLEVLQIANGFGQEDRLDLNSLFGRSENDPESRFVWQNDPSLEMLIQIRGGKTGAENTPFDLRGKNHSLSPNPPGDARKTTQRDVIGSLAYYSLDPAELKKPSHITRDPAELGQKGERFPSFLQEFLLVDRQAFHEMENLFYRRFPAYSGIVLDKGSIGGNLAMYLSVVNKSGSKLPIHMVSDGAVLSLAVLSICYQPNPPKILLLEEPENGVHHAKLKEIIDTLRDLSQKKGVQVVLTTHSPYLLDLVGPEEVRVFQKDEDGAVHSRKLSDFPDAEDLKKHFMTGEIWTILAETQKI